MKHSYVNKYHCEDCRRTYVRLYFRKKRAMILPPHEYVNSSHCGDCIRQYNRERMRDVRGSWAYI